MRRIPFDTLRTRLASVWRARSAAAELSGRPRDGRPGCEDVTFLLIHALETHGVGAGPVHLAAERLGHLPNYWHEHGVVEENLRRGIGPPSSGRFNNDYYGECTGGYLRAELWGVLNPGDPEEAALRAGEDARIDHCGPAVDAARFLAAVVAEAFTSSDLRAPLRAGLAQLHPASVVARCVSEATRLAARSDAGESWAAIRSAWAHPEPTHVLQNLGAVVLALAGSGGSWKRAGTLALGAGGDPFSKAVATATVLAASGAAVSAPGKGVAAERTSLENVQGPFGEEGFVERGLRLIVAASRRGQVEIVGAPYLPAPMPIVIEPARLVARYEGDPALLPDRPKAVFLERPPVTSLGRGQASFASAHQGEEPAGSLSIEAPGGLEVEPLGSVTGPDRLTARALNVRLKKGAPGRLPPVRVKVMRAGRAVAEAEFGFKCASRWVAFGPFENADGSGIERRFLPEAALSEATAPSKAGCLRREVFFAGDRIELDSVFRSPGPWVAYLVRTLVSPDRRAVALRIGASDGFKMWLNGKKLLEAHRHGFATPDDYGVPAVLKKGANRIVLKLARCGRSAEFRLRVTEPDSERGVPELYERF